jgi:ABC-type uncharacterized transport system permease subunit
MMIGNSLTRQRLGMWTGLSLALALSAFTVELLWWKRLLPIGSDPAQVLLGTLIVAWALVSLLAVRERPNWLLLVGALLACFLPGLLFGGLLISCASGDCL